MTVALEEIDFAVSSGSPLATSAPKNLSKYNSRINLDDDHKEHYAELSNPKFGKNANSNTDRSNRAVCEQVLDTRTRMILLKMINRNVFWSVNGCISTGKEANVYHAMDEEETSSLAIKIYKSTILTFKSREKYVDGEFRFRKGYSKHNPRKMVQVWAEKEFRNLKRLQVAGVPVPEPLELRSHVLVMGFVGDQALGKAAPRLKDARIDEAMAESLYNQLLRLMRTIYQECKLIHADLSEYNLLVHNGQIVVIDVSQSVEHDHPHALEFLRSDCKNVINFFRNINNVHTMDLRRLFDFVTDPSIPKDGIDEYLKRAHQDALEDIEAYLKDDALSVKGAVDEQVFAKSFIPRTLDEVIDIERDLGDCKDKDADLLYAKLMDLDLGANEHAVDVEISSGDDERSDEEGSESAQEDAFPTPLTKAEVKAQRKENKAATKEKQREKRKTKIPKHIKKRATKKQ